MLFRYPSSAWRSSGAIVFAIALLAWAPEGLGDAEPSLVPPNRMSGDAVVAVTGLPDAVIAALGKAELTTAAWTEIFAVRVADANADAPAVLGAYEIAERRILFTPRFPFVPNLAYTAEFDCAACATIAGVTTCTGEIVETFVLHAPEMMPSTTVTAIYPSVDLLPENVLKFYVYFSSPMRAGAAFANVYIIDDSLGTVVRDAFVETTPELWAGNMTRLTVICHPGRIKRGLAMREREGPPLRAGRSYRLVVGEELRDAYGIRLAASYEKRFRVGSADRESPSPDAWEIDIPRAGSLRPLRVRFGEALDHALASRLMTVRTRSGDALAGHIELVENEREWLYKPVTPWSAGDFDIVVHPTIEDLAGNRIDSLFDAPAGTAAVAGENPVRIPFAVE